MHSNFHVESSGSSDGYNLSHITEVNFTKVKRCLSSMGYFNKDLEKENNLGDVSCLLFIAKVVKYIALEIVRKEATTSTRVEGMNTKPLYSN